MTTRQTSIARRAAGIAAAVALALTVTLAPSPALAATSQQKAEAKALITQGIKNRDEVIDLKNTGLSYKEVSKVYEDVVSRNKDFWYVDTMFFWQPSNGKVETVGPFYKYESEKEYRKLKKRHAKYVTELNKAARYVMRYKGSKKRALAAHEYLTKRCRYDWSKKDSSASGYSALVNKKATCSGYAEAYKDILDKCGVSCKRIASTNHEWNLVKVGKHWYHVDVTFDDTTHTYRYFLKSTAKLKRLGNEHFPNTGGASCKSKKYDAQTSWKLK